MKEKFKGLLCAIGYVGIWFLVQLIVSGVIGAIAMTVKMIGLSQEEVLALAQNPMDVIGTTMPYILILSNLVSLGVFWLIAKCRKQKLSEKIMLKKTTGHFVVLGVCISIGMYCVNVGLVELLSRMSIFEQSYANFEQISQSLIGGNIFVALIGGVICAPIVEEVTCRGLVFQTLKKRFSIVWVIVIQAALFGLLHGNLVQFMYTMLVGMVWGYMMYKTGSLWVTILMHVLNNLFAMGLGMLVNVTEVSTMAMVLLLVIGGVIAGVGLYMVQKKSVGENTPSLEM